MGQTAPGKKGYGKLGNQFTARVKISGTGMCKMRGAGEVGKSKVRGKWLRGQLAG